MTTREELATSLGLPTDGLAGLDGLDGLTPERWERLTTLVTDAITREDDLVARSLDAALNAVPRPLRGRARTLLMEES